ncbi:helix-turn-helix domain-containing protein [Pseudomonas tohonis]|uniref:helix-turn-helix domain-containing protein n=1 Tax=Pseudomonas tohonis TaxID=2725477 RepID=UPI0021D9D576|nr:helix-turn-helix transcriptional regulator [Pseudomonas tohonis]UXY55082.1 helix-turn-helix domain-containing protein [Pseudomonas tohonis]
MQEEKVQAVDEALTIRGRIVLLWDRKNLSARDLEKLTGIDRTKWYALRNGRRRANEEDISSLVAAFPQFAYWLTTGLTAPEAGQISPEAHDQ